MNELIRIGVLQLLAAYLFLIIIIFIVRKRGIGREQEIFLAAARMTIQLILVGFLLEYVFSQEHFLYTVVILIIMLIFAVRNIFSRIKLSIKPELKRVVIISMLSGSLLSILYFLFVVLSLDPWYHPRYFILISGMIIGNSMTGVALGVERLISGMNDRKELIEGALMLGARPSLAAKSVVNDTFSAAILPTVNSMVGMGIVFLPGMMTGQILAGVSPLRAIEYQIAIMLGILGSVSLTVYLLVHFGYRAFFNSRDQLQL